LNAIDVAYHTIYVGSLPGYFGRSCRRAKHTDGDRKQGICA
jgi:hypothetical protein